MKNISHQLHKCDSLEDLCTKKQMLLRKEVQLIITKIIRTTLPNTMFQSLNVLKEEM